MIRHYCLTIIISALCASGCVLGEPAPRKNDWRAANIHSVVVVCIQGDQQVNRRIETNMVPKLRHQGFNAVAAQDFFPSASTYSPRKLLALMRGARIDGIMEITYPGKAPTEGMPQQFKIKYHSTKSLIASLSNSPRPLDAALLELIAGTSR